MPIQGAHVSAPGPERVYMSRQWEIDLGQRELRAYGAPVPIGNRAFEIISVLVQAAGKLVSKFVSLSDPALVPATVAGVLGLRLGGAEISAESVARAIGGKNLLVVLDNCEHVVDA